MDDMIKIRIKSKGAIVECIIINQKHFHGFKKIFCFGDEQFELVNTENF